MTNDLNPTNNIDLLLDSGVEISPLGSSESECDPDKSLPINDKDGKNVFFKGKTPEISSQVLNNKERNEVSSEKSDLSTSNNNAQTKKAEYNKELDKHSTKNKDLDTSSKIQKARSLGIENTSPQIIQAKLQLERLMRQLESKSAQKSAELEKVNQQLLSHSAELNKYNQEIEAKLAELKRAQSQLHKYVSESGENSPLNSPHSQSPASDGRYKSSSIMSPMSAVQNSNSSNDNNISNIQTRDVPFGEVSSPTKDSKISSPDFISLSNQLDQANKQLEKLQNQLNQFFNLFDSNSNSNNNSGINDSDFSKLIDQAKKDKELADTVKSTFPDITLKDIQERTIDLEPDLSQIEKLRNQLHQFIDIFSPDGDQKQKDNLSDEDFEKILNEAKAINDLSKSIEALLPPNEDIDSSLPQSKIDDIISQIKQLKSRSDELDEVLNQLKNANQQLDSKTNELENTQNQLRSANQLLDSKCADLDEINKKLEEIYKVIEVIEGEKISPEDMTEERLSEIIERVRNENREEKSDKEPDSEYNGSNLNKVSDFSSKELDINKDSNLNIDSNPNKELNLNEESNLNKESNLIKDPNLNKETNLNKESNFMKDPNPIKERNLNKDFLFSKDSDLNRGIDSQERLKKLSEIFNKPENLNDEEFLQVIELAKKNKELSDAIQSSLPGNSSNPDEIQEKIRDLKAKSTELEKVRQQFNSVIQAIEGDDEIRPETDEIPNERLSEIIEKAKKDKQISDSFQLSPPIDSNSGEIQEKIRDLEAKSAELSKIRGQLNSLVQAIEGNNESNNNDNDVMPSKKFLEVIEKAKTDKKISEIVQSTLPVKGKGSDAVEKQLNTLKKRSDQLDVVSNQLATKTAELEKVRKQISKLVDVINVNDDNDTNEPYDDKSIDRVIEKAKRRKLLPQINENNLETREVCLDVDDQLGYQNNKKTISNENLPIYGQSQQLNQFLSIFSEYNNDNVDLQNLDQNSFENIIKMAKKDKELAEAVKTTLPDHCSCGEEVQATINILKLRSSELDDRVPPSEVYKLRKRLEFLNNTVACLSQPKGPMIDSIEAEQTRNQDD
ncbi:hypothetical protein M9Y10_022956 [Tritrichomonas musculus]|uniref:Viral A-type inclusion protein n=1 Tax=Tritrichomonas musculus TaxID=1915356 RepID=A0ABR2KUC8_9EUKA